MDWRTKIALVVVVLGAGLAVALQFRKHTGAVSDAAPTAHSETATANDTLTKGPAAQNTVPYRPSSLDHLGETTQTPAAVTGDVAATAAAESTDTSAASSGAAKSGLVDLNAPQPTHKVVDGDTLPRLAQEYLGRSDRYMEIFDYNRDVLQSPDVLPIGAELRMPSRFSLPANESVTQKDVAPSTTTANPAASAAPLVPLIAPSATPVSSNRQKPRTYTVQRGDNLVDIARKMYGDGRRHQDLYEANRGVMHNPGDLRPGMVLVIP